MRKIKEVEIKTAIAAGGPESIDLEFVEEEEEKLICYVRLKGSGETRLLVNQVGKRREFTPFGAVRLSRLLEQYECKMKLKK